MRQKFWLEMQVLDDMFQQTINNSYY